MKQPEARIQKICIRLFDRYYSGKGVLHHSPNGGRRDAAEGAKFKAMGTRAGFPDLIWLYNGKATFFELKAEGGKLSEKQEAMIQELKKQGFDTYLITDVDQFDKILKAICSASSEGHPR